MIPRVVCIPDLSDLGINRDSATNTYRTGQDSTIAEKCKYSIALLVLQLIECTHRESAAKNETFSSIGAKIYKYITTEPYS